MQIHLESFPANGSDTLRTLVFEKVNRLDKFFSRIVEADVYLKNIGGKEEPFSAELRLNVPNDTLFCSEKGASYEEAIDRASRAMERQLKKFKEKISAH